MRLVGILVAVAAALIASSTPAAAAAPSAPAARPACTTTTRVSAPTGRFCGLAVTVDTADVDAYEGIRYGRAKRWAAPAAVSSGSSLVRATAFGPICPQAPADGLRQSEDCLFLNLWTPAASSAGNLPVMVFIHGGAFVSGAGSLPIYDGARLAARGHVVVVTFNYRLGALGFLAGGSGADQLVGNYGFRDQQLALRWVHDNIESFGGDPAKVTIFGESAGAMSVGAHLVARGSRPLFGNAIEESNPYGVPFKTLQQAAMIRTEFDRTPPAAVCEGRRSCLLTLSPAKIVAAQADVVPAQAVFKGELGALLAWAPFVDRELIAGQPNAAKIRQSVIAGTNRDEGTLFVGEAFPEGLSNAEYEVLVSAVFGLNALRILDQQRYAPDGGANLVPLANIVGDYFFSCATRHVLSRATGSHFGYAFDHPPSYAVWPGAPAACQPGRGLNQGRVCHGFELPFVFRNPVTLTVPAIRQSFTRAEEVLVDAMSSYWTGFAAAGDPNAGAASPPEWPRYGVPGTRQVLDLKISRTTDGTLDCSLWDAVGYGPGSASLF